MEKNINIDKIQEINPWITDNIKGDMVQFYKEGLKTSFEKANLNNSIKFFEETYQKGWSKCIIAHRNGCIGCTSFNNYDTWLKKAHPGLLHDLFQPDQSQSEREWNKVGGQYKINQKSL